MTDYLEKLKVIAKDEYRLTRADRHVLQTIAENLDGVQKQLVETQAALIESQQQRIALNEALLDLRKRLPSVLPHPISMQLLNATVQWNILKVPDAR